MPHLTLTLQIRSKKNTSCHGRAAVGVQLRGTVLTASPQNTSRSTKALVVDAACERTKPRPTAYRATIQSSLEVVRDARAITRSEHSLRFCLLHHYSSMQHFFQIWLFIVCLDCRPKQTNLDHLTYLLLQSCGIPVIVLYMILF